MSNADNTKVKRASAPVLIHDPSETLKPVGVSMLLLLPAAVVSAVVHVGLIAALFLLPAPSGANPPPLEDTKNEVFVQGDAPPPPPEAKDPLLITEVDPAGADPDIKINYNNDRKEEVSVPGVVNPDEPVGI